MKRPLSIAVVLVLLGVFLVGAWIVVQASSQESPAETPDPVSDLVGEDFVFAPDGNSIAYSVNSQDHGELWVMRGDDRELLYSGTGVAIYSPVWSPNGEMIAFAKVQRDEGPDGSQSGHLCYVDGGAAVLETELRVSVHRYEFRHEVIQWSPDSRLVLVCPTPIALWDVQQKQAVVLADIRQDGRKTQMASFSPSGRHVSFKEITADGQEAVLVVDLDTMNTRIVSSVAATAIWDSPAGPPRWLAENTIVFLAPHDGEKLALVKTDLSTGAEQQLAFPAGHFVVSPDRKKIALITVRDNATVNALVDVETGTVKDCPGTNGELMSWSPDGMKLLLFDLGGIRSLDVTSSSLSSLVSDVLPGWRPAWSPDSTVVAVGVRTNGTAGESKLNLVTIK